MPVANTPKAAPAPLHSTTIDPAGLYRFNSFAPILGCKRTKWFMLYSSGRAPKAFLVESHSALWRGADLLDWLADPTTWAERHAAALQDQNQTQKTLAA